MKKTVAVRRKTKQNRDTGWGQHKLGENFESRNFLHNYWVHIVKQEQHTKASSVYLGT